MGGAVRLTKAGELLTGARVLEELCAYFLSKSFPAFLEESVTYQDILAKGEAKGRAEVARNWLLRLGRKKFGEPDAETLNILQSLTDLERLKQLLDRLLEVENWSELLA